MLFERHNVLKQIYKAFKYDSIKQLSLSTNILTLPESTQSLLLQPLNIHSKCFVFEPLKRIHLSQT